MSFTPAAPTTPATARRKTFGLLCALLCVLLAAVLPAQAVTFTVVNNANSGAGSLRQAVLDANATPGADTINFNVNSFTIAPISAFASLSDTVTIDGTTQPGYAGTPIIVLDGSGAGASSDGLAVRAPNCVIRGLTIQNYAGNGISIAGATVTGCSVTGCRIGTNSAGTVAAPNNNGVAIFNGAKNNTVGGTTAAAMNLISGNTSNGVLIFGAGTDNNTVLGNRIGTNADGTAKVANGTGAIIFGGAKSNHIGTAAMGNYISGNTGSGIQIFDIGTTGNTVQRNVIGLNQSGLSALGNGSHGVHIFDGASNNVIGGAERNIICGNSGSGVLIDGVATNSNTMPSNLIGINGSNQAIGNIGAGVQIQDGASNNTIGANSLTSSGSNVISSNGSGGIKIIGVGTTGNTVIGSTIGLDSNGTIGRANTGSGVEIINGATSNIIGGASSGLGNVISGNTGVGVQIGEAGTNNNQVIGNRIGTNAAGTVGMRNGLPGIPREGVYITGGAQNNIIGGTTSGAGNTISGNTDNGVTISGTGTSGDRLMGNRIGTDAAGTSAIPNGIHGVEIRNGATDNIIGLLLSTPGSQGPVPAGNTIAFNVRDGVRVSSTSSRSVIRGNQIFQNGELGINLSGGNEDPDNVTSNDYEDPSIGFDSDMDTGANLLQNYPVLSQPNLIGSNFSNYGYLRSAPSTTFVIDFYRSAQADPSGYGEGQTYLGSVSATTNSDGVVEFLFTSQSNNNQPGFITATATDSNGNTSEFSEAAPILIHSTYSISGRLTNSNGGAAVAGVAVALSGNSTATATTNANGDYVFSNLTAGSYTITPSASSGYSFTPTSRNVSITNASVSGQNFSGVASTTGRIIGRISDSSGNALGGVTVTRTGTGQTTVTTNSAGYYTFSALTPGTYTVTASRTGYSFTPASRSVTVTGGDVAGQNFIGNSGPPPAATYRIIGRISDSSGNPIAGVTVTRTGTGQTTTTTNSAGYYILTGVPAGTYTVTASRAGYTFTPASRTVTVVNADVTGQNFIGQSGPQPAASYRIYGRISTSSNQPLEGIQVFRSGSATPVLTNNAGYYMFTGVPNGTYMVTPQGGRTFVPASKTVTINNADAGGQNFLASG